LAKKWRLNAYAPYVFGLHFVVLMLHWGNTRVPVVFEIVRRKEDPKSRLENALFRRMLTRFRRPAWAEMLVVVADATFASKANLKLIRRRGYFIVIAFARMWHFADGQTLKDLVTHLPKQHDRLCWVPLDTPGRRRTYWTYTKQARLRDLGAVTVVSSKQRRNDGPQRTKILVANLPEAGARQVVDVYRRRWSVEVCQTQPIKMSWCPLRRAPRTISDLRGFVNREHVIDSNLRARHHDFAHQAVSHRLARCKRELVQIVTQQAPKGVGRLKDLLPRPRLWLGAG
jgi:hypothetical protein